MPPVAHHALLGVATAALACAGLRAGGSLGARGVSRALAAAPIAVTAAVVEALAFGLVGLGSSPAVLVAAACATWLAARALFPAAPPSDGRPTRHSRARVVALGAGGGALAALVVWLLKYPGIGGDGLAYHLPEVVRWVQSGRPGTIVALSPELPFGNYPLTNEGALAWGTGIARSFVFVTLWTPATYLLLLVAAWWGLRELRVRGWIAALAAAALGSSPILVAQLLGPNTDLPALAWLVTCAALCAGSRRLPGLLAPALLAAALAVGTKTTTLPLAAVCLALAFVSARGGLAALARPLAAAAVAGAVAGGTWYLRNLLAHGSPFWPFAATPWGDPKPPLLDRLDGRLISEPGTVKGRLEDYGRVLAGAVALLAGGLVAPLLRRRREVVVAAAATALALLAWASAPFTAFPQQPFFDSLAAGATRYLAPAFAAGALALALAASGRGTGAWVAGVVLAVAIGVNLARDAALGFPYLPSVVVLVAGAVLGGAVAVPEFPRRVLGRLSPAWAAAAVVVAGTLLSAAASGYVERQSRIAPFSMRAVAWLVSRPGFRSGDGAVAMQGRLHGTLAGDRIQHELAPLEPIRGCAAVRAFAERGWVLVSRATPPAVRGFEDVVRRFRRVTQVAERCLRGIRPVYADEATRIYAVAPAGEAPGVRR